jgi:2-polyprenyl-3-methyl-5-hydroxy-6-metoxy-1,4-benzoquinol methylase
MDDAIANETKARALRSGGASENAVYAMIERALRARNLAGLTVVDLGCGSGALQPALASYFASYVGVDVVRYDGFPNSAKFVEADLNASAFPLPSSSADAVIAAETIEHLENPRALIREMTRIARPGGWVIITTPNQLSLLSLGTLALKRRFSAFQDVHYPAHITALLECDLRRIANEVGLLEASIEFSRSGRVPLSPWHYPAWISNASPRLFSDNILLIGRAP